MSRSKGSAIKLCAAGATRCLAMASRHRKASRVETAQNLVGESDAREACSSPGRLQRLAAGKTCAAGAALYYVAANAATGRASGFRPHPLAPTRTCEGLFVAKLLICNGTEAPCGFGTRDGAEPRRGERREMRAAQIAALPVGCNDLQRPSPSVRTNPVNCSQETIDIILAREYTVLVTSLGFLLSSRVASPFSPSEDSLSRGR